MVQYYTILVWNGLDKSYGLAATKLSNKVGVGRSDQSAKIRTWESDASVKVT